MALQTTFRTLCGHDAPSLFHSSSSSAFLSKQAFMSHFSVPSNPSFISALFDSISTDNRLSVTQFRDFFVDMTRSSPSRPLVIFLTLVEKDELILPTDKLTTFFRLLIDFSGCASATTESSPEIVVKQLAGYCTSRTNYDTIDMSNTSSLLSFLLTNLPFAPHVIISFFYSKVCPELTNPMAYFPPSLSPSESTILPSPCHLFPLSLLSRSLQGSWIRLFSSDSNGFSFNRIAHHILGYNVQHIDYL